MISARALDQAVAEAVVSAEQAQRLREIERALVPAQASEPQDEESLRFLTGFADIFVTIGLVLFLGALSFLMFTGTGSTLMYAGLAACSWVLAEFFTFKRRMALPSIVLLVVFVSAVFVLSEQIAAALLPPTASLFQNPIFKGWLFTPDPHAPPPQTELLWPDWLPLCVGGIVTAASATIHYIRFRVPITIAAGVAPICVLVVALVAGLVPSASETLLNATLLVLGLAVFALAMRFDMSDPARTTRRNDIAFWLHLLAAPLVVHPLIRGFMHGMDARLTPGAAAGVLWVFLALGVVAVVIDRRAILVSGLVYAGIAYGSFVRALGGQGYTVPIVLLSLGAFILLLSAGWQPLRRALLKRLPPRLAGRLPHPLVVSNA